ncbi:MAG TPA: hypothetical protein VMY69_08595, partial [Phycisphaerae bacterium]|nr:hypothetical protein [Phycisphaerae bacterium]
MAYETTPPRRGEKKERHENGKDSMMGMAEEVQIETLRMDGGTQPRATLDARLIEEYGQAMGEGA